MSGNVKSICLTGKILEKKLNFIIDLLIIRHLLKGKNIKCLV